MVWVVGIAKSQVQTASQSPPVKSTGIIQLPIGEPPATQQSPVPPPAFRERGIVELITRSPQLSEIHEWLRGNAITETDAISLALSLNRSLAASQVALSRAVGHTTTARTAFSPTAGVSPFLVYEETSLQPEVFIGATLPIDISGLLHASADQARFQEIGSRLDINRIRNQVVAEVKFAYYEVLRAKALSHVSDENLKNTVVRLSDAEKKLEARAVTRFDVIRAQTDVISAQQQSIRAANAVTRSIGQLNSVIGLNILTPLIVVDTIRPEIPSGVKPQPPGTDNRFRTGQNSNGATAESTNSALAGLVDVALTLRPEILETQAGIAAAKRGIVIAKRSELPSIGFSVGYFNQRNSTGNTRINDPRAFLNLNIPLFDGGLSRARASEARADVAAAEQSLRQATDLITLDVQQAYLNLIQARDQIAVTLQGLDQARQGFELARVRYNAGVSARAGLSPLLEVSDAQAALTLAETNQVNALYDYNNGRAQLDRAIGRYAYTGVGPGYLSKPAAPLGDKAVSAKK